MWTLFLAGAVTVAIFAGVWWMNQPIEVIYDPNGPLYWWNDGGYH